MGSEMVTTGHDGEGALFRRDRAEQLTNGVYGGILVTAFLGTVEDHAGSAAEVLGELVGASVVVFLAHTYASLLGTGVVESGWTGHVREVVRNQLPLVTVVTVPSLFLVLAMTDMLTLDAAVVLGLVAGIVGLFGLGYLLATESGGSTRRAIVTGVVGAVLGMVVVGLEAGLH